MTLDFWAPAIDKGASGADLGPTKEGIAGHIIKRRFADPYSALPVRAGIPPVRRMAVFAAPFWTLSIADTPHHSPPGRRSSHPIRALRGGFRRHHSAPGIQPCGDHSDTGLRPAPAPFARALPATPAGSYSQWRA